MWGGRGGSLARCALSFNHIAPIAHRCLRIGSCLCEMSQLEDLRPLTFDFEHPCEARARITMSTPTTEHTERPKSEIKIFNTFANKKAPSTHPTCSMQEAATKSRHTWFAPLGRKTSRRERLKSRTEGSTHCHWLRGAAQCSGNAAKGEPGTHRDTGVLLVIVRRLEARPRHAVHPLALAHHLVTGACLGLG